MVLVFYSKKLCSLSLALSFSVLGTLQLWRLNNYIPLKGKASDIELERPEGPLISSLSVRDGGKSLKGGQKRTKSWVPPSPP